jgi:hypothetical protein
VLNTLSLDTLGQLQSIHIQDWQSNLADVGNSLALDNLWCGIQLLQEVCDREYTVGTLDGCCECLRLVEIGLPLFISA